MVYSSPEPAAEGFKSKITDFSREPTLNNTPLSNTDKMRSDLRKRIVALSFQQGEEFILSSGKKSNFYFNMKPTMMDPEGSYLIAKLIIDRIKTMKTKVEYVGGLEMGAVPIVSAISPVSYQLDSCEPVKAFFVRKKAKQYGTKSQIEGLAKNETLEGKNVVIVDDVTTTGNSMLEAARVVEKEGGNVVEVITIVDRKQGAEAEIAKHNLTLYPFFDLDDFMNEF